MGGGPVSVQRAVVLAVIAVAMFGLKRHYSTAAVEDLRWILWPTSALAGLLSGSPFEFEAGAGYLSRDRFFVIEKSCAGVNFMIAALGLLGFGLGGHADRTRRAVPIVAASLAVSYAAAVFVNTARILVALWVPSAEVASGWWTAARVHRVEGIAVYFGGLVLLHLAMRALPPVGRGPAAP
jgi:exosortase K